MHSHGPSVAMAMVPYTGGRGRRRVRGGQGAGGGDGGEARIRARMQEYRTSGSRDPIDLMDGREEIDWQAFGLDRGMTQAEVDSIHTARLEYNFNVRDPNRAGMQRLEIKLFNDDVIFRLYPGAPVK